MKLQLTMWPQRTTLLLIAFSALAAMQPVRADEYNIYGFIDTMNCVGTPGPVVQGFAVFSFSFGDKNPSSASSGAGASRPTFLDVTVVKGLDDCTPFLFGAVSTGKHFKKATLTAVPKGSSTAVLLIELDTVLVTSDKFNEGDPNELDEVITLSYGKITITHVPSGKSVVCTVTNGSCS